MKKNLFVWIGYIFVIGNLCSCGIGNDLDYDVATDIEIMNKGFEYLKSGDSLSAATTFEQVDYNHPYSEFLPASWYLAGYSYYKERRYTEAIEQFQKLLQFQPNHPKVPYAMYMIAMSYYDQISPINRDQVMSAKALAAMLELVEKYPDTVYAKDVEPKIIIARNNLAAKEMFTAKTLSKKKNIIAALNRYQTVIKQYETTLFVPEALFRTIEIYAFLGELDDAKNMLKVLELNYPDSEWCLLAKKVIDDYKKSNN